MKKQNLALNITRSVILALLLTSVFTTVALADELDSPAGIPTRLAIPSIALDREVFPVGWTPISVEGLTAGRWDTLDNDVAWHNESAKLGQMGNTVLNGHSDVHARVFRDLTNVEIGDEIIAYSGEHPYHYIVTEKILVREHDVFHQKHVENAKLIASTDDERLTLITCAGRGATHRLIVIARPAR